MILNKLKQTNKLIELKRNSDSFKRDLEYYNDKISKIKKIREISSNYSISLINLSSMNEDEFVYNNLTRLLKELCKIENYSEVGQLDSNIICTIDSLIKELEKKLKEQWRQYHIRKTASLLNTILSLQKISDESDKINIINNSLKCFYWPVNERVEKIIKQNIDDAKKIIDSLNVNEEILDFLRKISENRATIFDLKQEILDWIKTKKLENKISLNFKS